MRSISKTKETGSLVDELRTTTVPFDSWEVFQLYYLGKMKLWEDELRKLNILENPVEIQFLCKEILKVKNLLGRMK